MISARAGETFDEVRAGARLVLSYDSTANVFIGTVENTPGHTWMSRSLMVVHQQLCRRTSESVR